MNHNSINSFLDLNLDLNYVFVIFDSRMFLQAFQVCSFIFGRPKVSAKTRDGLEDYISITSVFRLPFLYLHIFIFETSICLLLHVCLNTFLGLFSSIRSQASEVTEQQQTKNKYYKTKLFLFISLRVKIKCVCLFSVHFASSINSERLISYQMWRKFCFFLFILAWSERNGVENNSYLSNLFFCSCASSNNVWWM